MAKIVYEAKVTGRMPFPIDMLRYDRAYPATEQDSVQIAAACDRQQEVRYRTVTVISENPLTSARWESFGWQIERDSLHTRRVG